MISVSKWLRLCSVNGCGCVQYPLKEIVVIHKDTAVLQDVTSLQNYIMEVTGVLCDFRLFVVNAVGSTDQQLQPQYSVQRRWPLLIPIIINISVLDAGFSY